MAPLPPAVGVVKLQFGQECSGRNFTDRIFIQNATESEWSMVDLTNMATTMAIGWHTYIAPFQDAATLLTEVIATDLTSEMGLQSIVTPGTAGTFGGTAQLPINCQARVTQLQPRRYRGGRPGFNITGLDRTEMFDDRTIETSVVEAIQGNVHEMLFAFIPSVVLTTGSPHCVVVSYFTDHAERPAPLILAPYEVEVQSRLCTLRKRLGKGESG